MGGIKILIDLKNIDEQINNPPEQPDPISALPKTSLLGKIRDFFGLIFGGVKKKI